MLALFRKSPSTEVPRGVADWLLDVEQRAGNAAEDLIVDVGHVESLNSAEIGLLIEIRMRLLTQNCRLILANVSEAINELLSLTRVNRMIEVRLPNVSGNPEPAAITSSPSATRASTRSLS